MKKRMVAIVALAGLIFAVLTVLSLGYAVILDGLKYLGGRLVPRMGAVLRKKC